MKRLFSFASLAVLVAVVAAGCNFSISTANITQAMLSKDVKGDAFEPVDAARRLTELNDGAGAEIVQFQAKRTEAEGVQGAEQSD